MSDLAAPANADSKLTELNQILSEGDFDRLENLWMEVLGNSGQLASSVAELAAAGIEGLRLGYEAEIKPLLELTWGALGEGEDGAPLSVTAGDKAALGEALVRAFPSKKEYLAYFLDAFLESNDPMSVERAFFNACGIEDAPDKVEALDRLRQLLEYKPGAIVYHESGWGMGEVLEVDALLGQVKVDLDEKKDHRISIDAVDSILQLIPEDSFRGLCYRSSEELTRLVEEDPVSLVQKVLDDFGSPMAQKNIKAHLTAGAIDAAGWTRWWGRAKKELRASGFYRIGDRSPYHVEKLEEAVSFEEELIARFKTAEWSDGRLAVRELLKGGEKKYPNAYPELVSGLIGLLGPGSNKDKSLEICLFLSRVKEADDSWVEVFKLITNEELVASLEALPVGEDPRKVFKLLGELRADDQLPVASAAFICKSDNIRKVAFEVLDSVGADELTKICSQVYASPRIAPEACLWLLKRRLAGQTGTGLESLFERSSRELLILMVDLLEHLIDKEARLGRSLVRDLIKKIEPLMFYEDGSFFREAIEIMETPEREMVYRRVLRNQEYLPNNAHRFLDIISQIEPVISLDNQIPDWENPDIIFSTSKGEDTLKEELRELNEVKLPEIAKAIGAAADLGDLSENAEFTSALEERDSLVSKAEKIQDDLKKIVLIDASQAEEGIVGLGSKVSAENLETGERVTYAVLGPWDGGPEDGVLNYRSPLGQFFLGASVDDELDVVLPGGATRYKILGVESISD